MEGLLLLRLCLAETVDVSLFLYRESLTVLGEDLVDGRLAATS